MAADRIQPMVGEADLIDGALRGSRSKEDGYMEEEENRENLVEDDEDETDTTVVELGMKNPIENEDDEIEDDSVKNQAIEGHNGTTQIGVIAQELEPILPDAIITNSDTTVKTVEGDSIKWYLVNAVKELSAQNDALVARITALESN